MKSLQQERGLLLVIKKLERRLSPAQMIALSFLLIIIIGGLLLCLPVSHAGHLEVSPVDAFFTAVSAVCVTGLVTVTTAAAWSISGKIVILLLIQIGGLSLITLFTFLMVYIGRKISLKNRLLIQTAYYNDSLGGAVRMVIMIIKGTLICELTGAVFLFIFFFSQGTVWYKALFYGVFHSVSAFCNAGFDVMGDSNFIPYVHHFGINLVLMVLVVTGGIGFSVWRDLLGRARLLVSKRRHKAVRLSLHSRLVLVTTGVLLVFGTLFILVEEYNNPATLGGFSFPEKLLASLFQSVTLRTAGFMTVPQGALTESSKLFSCLLMLIGGSPGGTAGGMKTVSIAVIICSVWSIVRSRSKIVVFKREISVTTLQNALAVVVLMLILLFFGTAILAFTEKSTPFPHTVSDLLFEVSSALGTVGLTTGITPFLSKIGKFVLMLCMFIGRIGPITLIISLKNSLTSGSEVVGYPHEDVMIG